MNLVGKKIAVEMRFGDSKRVLTGMAIAVEASATNYQLKIQLDDTGGNPSFANTKCRLEILAQCASRLPIWL